MLCTGGRHLHSAPDPDLEPAPVTPGAVGPAQPRLIDIEVVRGKGSWVEASDGRRYLDLTSGIACLNLGHGHPAVVAAVQRQVAELAHSGGVFGHGPMNALAARLGEIAPGPIDRFLFCASGSEANELAIRMARELTGRPGVVAFRGGFHGRTQGALSCTTSRAAFRSGTLGAGVAVSHFPRPFAWGVDPDTAAERALAELDELHRHELRPDQTACYLVEPVQGQGGCHPAGARFLQGLRERADRAGALLVVDEVQTGLGRTGAWFCAELESVAPDLVTMAKALGAGLPLAAVGGAESLMAAFPAGAHGSTFGGSPLACAAALAGIEAIEDEGLIARARELGELASARLRSLSRRLPYLADVRGRGLMIGLEIGDPRTRAPLGALAERICGIALEAGLLLIRSGPDANVIRLLPPLTITDGELELALAGLERALESVSDGLSTTPILRSAA
jgi:4-aminobutyrate aminotransferase